MTTFRILLNRTLEDRRYSVPGYRQGDVLEEAHQGVAATDDSEAALLDAIFELYNTCHPADYHDRSLSVGDVVEINGRHFSCDSAGWTRIRPVVVVKTLEAIELEDLALTALNEFVHSFSFGPHVVLYDNNDDLPF